MSPGLRRVISHPVLPHRPVRSPARKVRSQPSRSSGVRDCSSAPALCGVRRHTRLTLLARKDFVRCETQWPFDFGLIAAPEARTDNVIVYSSRACAKRIRMTLCPYNCISSPHHHRTAAMKAISNRIAILVSVMTVSALSSSYAAPPAASSPSGPPFTGETFLPNYDELKPRPGKGGVEYVYLSPAGDQLLSRFTGIMLDQPEVFISADSPYKGAKPADLTGIAEFVRSAYTKELKARNYKLVDAKGPGVLYVRIAVTGLQLKPKSRSILAYTPAGFVISTAVRAMQDTLAKMDILQIELQSEYLDGETGEEVAAGVAPRGGYGRKMSFSELNSLIEGYGQSFACRFDNARVSEDQRIDCTDPKAREARKPVAKVQ